MATHECLFPEEREPSGRLILVPCLECQTTALDALEQLASDLADEKRRHAELRAGVEALADEWEGYGHGKFCVHVDDPGCHACKIVIALRALLNTATEETP